MNKNAYSTIDKAYCVRMDVCRSTQVGIRMFNIYNGKSKRKVTMVICIVLIVAMVATSVLAMLS